MRITPAKWDAEYVWLKNENGVRAMGASPKVDMPTRRAVRAGRPSALGAVLQAFGVVLLSVLAAEGNFMILLPLGAVLMGELIFINSLGHVGKRSPGE